MIVLEIILFVAIALLILIILAVLAFLFAPVKYVFSAESDFDEGEKSLVSFRLNWFFRFFRIVYEEKKLKIYVMWFYEVRRKKKSRKKRKKDGNGNSENKVSDEVRGDDNSDLDADEGSENTESGFKKFVESIKSVLKYPDKGLILEYSKTLLLRLLRAFKPKEFLLYLEVGFDSPSDTGYLLGVLGIIQGISGLDMIVDGNFEEKTLKYRINVKDSFMIWSYVWPLVAWALKKPISSLLKKYF